MQSIHMEWTKNTALALNQISNKDTGSVQMRTKSFWPITCRSVEISTRHSPVFPMSCN